MEILVEQGRLAKALNVVSRVAGGSTTLGPMLPILNNILIRVKDNRVSLTATNLEIAIVEYIKVLEMKEGELTVPAKLLADFVSNLPKDEQIRITEKDNKVVVKAGRYSSILNGMSAEEFPELPEISEEEAVIFRAGVDDFKQSVSSVVIACSNNTTRPVLTGVYFGTVDEVLYLAATDGYRLAEKRFIEKVKSEVRAIVPATSLQEVLRILNDEMSEIEILIDETQMRFRIGEIEVTSKLIDGSYVDYRGLIPTDTKIKAIIPRSEMQRVTKLAASFAKSSGGAINCEAKAEKKVLSVSAVANEFGENDSEIEVDVMEDGKVTLNSKYLLDVLNVMDTDEILFGFSEKISPLVVRSNGKDDFVYIIMPHHG